MVLEPNQSSSRKMCQCSFRGRDLIIFSVLLVFTMVCLPVFYLRLNDNKPDSELMQLYDEYYAKHDIYNGVEKLLTTSAPSLCTAPDLPLFNDLIRNSRPNSVPSDHCNSETPLWLEVSNSRILFKPQYANASCVVEPIVRVDDMNSKLDTALPIKHGAELPSLGFQASCTMGEGRSHSSVYYGVKRNHTFSARAKGDKTAQHDNIIMIGFDSVSRLETLRSLNRTSQLMKSRLNGITLMHYNVAGDGTFQNLLPLLTGVRQEEFPKEKKYVDDHTRFIFQDLKELNYATLWGEEQPKWGTFRLTYPGFKTDPVDFNLCPIQLLQEKMQTNDICIGDQISSVRMLQAVKDLFQFYPNRPKFAFVFFSLLSHQNKDTTLMDPQVSKFFEWFLDQNLMRNTTLIFMSDHGKRHGPARNSMQGKLEELLPLMTIALSHQLTNNRPTALRMLQANVNRLTTPSDIYHTLLSIAGVRNANHTRSKVASYSLIDQIVAANRTCPSAGIPPTFCSCLRMKKIEKPQTQQLPMRAGQFLVGWINSRTQQYRSMCRELQLQNISDAEISMPDDEVAKRRRDPTTGKITLDSGMESFAYLNIRFWTAPNDGLFDATVQVQFNSNLKRQLFVLTGEVSRINEYGDQPKCIVKQAAQLRKYCLCLDATT